LQQYNHRLVLNTQEVIWLDETANQTEDLPLEMEVAVEDLLETLPPDGHFDPGEWLYQQMCLALPQRQLCNVNCPGILNAAVSEPPTDSRWALLDALKKQLPDN
jgi:uncharacterized protein